MPQMQRPDVSRRRPPAGWTAAAARDRLSATLFCAALLHGILILGVTFTGESARRSPPSTSLDVVIVTRDYESRPTPRNPALIAEQNLIGRGNAPLTAKLRTAVAASPDEALIRPDQDGSVVEPREAGEPQPAADQLTSRSADREQVLVRRPGESPEQARQRLLAGSARQAELLASPDLETIIPDANPRVLVVSANTRESRIASYLNQWKTRVERVGTLNFPNAAALATIDSYPVLEVAISARGELEEVVVLSSSGYPNLDQTATEILRLAAPFEPFPAALAEQYDVLRFAYEWRFGTGRIRAARAY